MTEPVRFAWAPDVLTRRVGTSVLVTRPADPRLHELSGAACAIWSELDVPHALPELVARIAGSYGAEPHQLEGSVSACVDALLGLGVIRSEGDVDG